MSIKNSLSLSASTPSPPRFVEEGVKKLLGCTKVPGCVKLVDHPRDAGIYLVGRLSSNFHWTSPLPSECDAAEVRKVVRGFDLMPLLRAAELPRFGIDDACKSNRNIRSGGVKMKCPKP